MICSSKYPFPQVKQNTMKNIHKNTKEMSQDLLKLFSQFTNAVVQGWYWLKLENWCVKFRIKSWFIVQGLQVDRNWKYPFPEVKQNVDISLESIIITKCSLHEGRKPSYWSQGYVIYILINRRITGSQYSIHYNAAFICHRDIQTYKPSVNINTWYLYIYWV